MWNALTDCFKSIWSSHDIVNQNVVSLWNGEHISESTLKETLVKLDKLKQHVQAVVPTYDLLCKAHHNKHEYANYPGAPKSALILKECNLVDEKGELSEEMAIVIRNCFQHGQYGVIPLNPLTGKQLEKSHSWSEITAYKIKAD